jgi:hypothetical protein
LQKKPALARLRALRVAFKRNFKMIGWRRSADRTRLRANSLLTGNLTGKIAVLGPREVNREQEMPVLQWLLEKFPTQINRENILKNRELKTGNREINLQNCKKDCKRPFLARLFPRGSDAICSRR